MNHILKLLSIAILLTVSSQTGEAQTAIISKTEALQMAKAQFDGQDVDYYLMPGYESGLWSIFVDAHPMKGWEHDCYVVQIPTKFVTDGLIPSQVTTTLHRIPPVADYEPLDVKNRYGENSTIKPKVPKKQQGAPRNPVAERTYAIILNGGIEPQSNHERYWNDCSFIYQTLVNTYGIPKDNIYPIMSDGSEPTPDMLTADGTRLINQSLDLDFDGEYESIQKATKSNIQTALNSIYRRINNGDHLFFYVIDHGSKESQRSLIHLWGIMERIYDTELAGMLNPFINYGVTVNVVMGQCNSGGFVDNLTKIGCVVTTACTGTELSNACPDIPYDEFVYHWTCAVNGANHLNNVVSADSDNNGYVSMKEAYEYAKENDRHQEIEHPQYLSTPASVGEDLAFNHLPGLYDLFIRDIPEDTGIEPNTITDENWRSPSIWVRNEKDGETQHQNPEYTTSHTKAYVYVKVENRGREASPASGQYLNLYWAQASTAMDSRTWKGKEKTPDGYPTGGFLGSMPVGAIPAGGEATLCVDWKLPELMKESPEGAIHFCLLAKISDSAGDDGYVEGTEYFDILGSNDQAQRNLSIIRGRDILNRVSAYVRNTTASTGSYTLELRPQTEADAKFYSIGTVGMALNGQIASGWEQGGSLKEYAEEPKSAPSDGKRRVKMLSGASRLLGIKLQPAVFDKVTLTFDFVKIPATPTTYTFDLIQKDAEGRVMGGETFVVESPSLVIAPLQITSTEAYPGEYGLEVSDTQYVSFAWYDADGDRIGDDRHIETLLSADETTVSAMALTEEGEMAQGEAVIPAIGGIREVTRTASGTLLVRFETASMPNSRLVVSPLTEVGESILFEMPEAVPEYEIDITSLTAGFYILTYHTSGRAFDSIKFSVE